MELSREADLSAAQLWDAMERLQETAAAESDQPLDDLLEQLVTIFGADRGCVIQVHEDGSTTVTSGRTYDRQLSITEREEVSKTVMREALQTRRPVLHIGADDALESIAELEILGAIAAPIIAGDSSLHGAIYLDVRTHGKCLGPRHLELAAAAARLVSLVIDRHQRPKVRRQATPRDEHERLSLEAILDLPGLTGVREELAAWVHADLPLLITGESGVGKTLLATALAHELGRQPIVRATLGSTDDLNTLTSELFGHERGSFSGALTRRSGLVETAHGGTLILDEVLSLPSRAQQLLLDFTQFGSYRPLGYTGVRPKRADVRLIAVTNGDLEAAVAEGRFRQDLFYRLVGAAIRVPPLRERREDVPTLIERTLERIDPGRGWRLGVSLRRVLVSEDLDWSGNVRQLDFTVRRLRMRALAQDPEARSLEERHLRPADLGFEGRPTSASKSLGDRWTALQRSRTSLDRTEVELIEGALRKWGGVVSRAARELGAKRTSLLSRMRKLGIERWPDDETQGP